jgi:hypothetical protein
VIVIPEHRVDAMSRAQFAQQLGTRRGITTFLGHVITSQGNDVGMQAISRCHCAFDLVAAGKRTVVNIGKLDNAETIEFTRQASQMNLVMFDG